MHCAAKGLSSPCIPGRPKRRCGLCGAVSYCSPAHQKLHWNDHKEECARFEQQRQRAELLSDFAFSFSGDPGTSVFGNQLTRCSFLASSGLHLKALWKFECNCWLNEEYLENNPRLNIGWNLPASLCPCSEPSSSISICLRSWSDYYRWRGLPIHSPAALLLHWALNEVLGPEKELSQFAVFAELRALLPGIQLHIEFVGPGVPQYRDGEIIKLDKYAQCIDGNCSCKPSSSDFNTRSCHTNSTLTLTLHKGFYHEKYRYMDSHPHMVIAPNAGIAAYPSWMPSIELISKLDIPAIFSDFCEEAAFLATRCIRTVTGCPLTLPVQVNPFRQPMAMEEQALDLPCYSNCFLFGL